MRQVGVIAAAARVALRDWERLEQDHLLAARLAAGIADHAPSAVDPASVETNIVNVVVDHLKRPWPEITGRLATAAVAVNAPINGVWRLVTHRDVDQADVDRLVAAISR